GQGQVYLGHDTYTEADFTAGGEKTASFSLQAPYVAGGDVIATATDAEGNTSEFGAPNVSVGADRDPSLPDAFALAMPWPNPVRHRVTVRVALPKASRLTVEVYDALGRRVRQLDDDDRPAGWHELALDADGLASGVYLVRMTAGEGTERFTATRRITVVR
ncbi:MAG: T9SS type A sorting domain-containing protein, partial [Bacteroidota bacterium]